MRPTGFRTFLFATVFGLCASGAAAAQEQAPGGAPMVMDLETDQSFLNSAPSPSGSVWDFETSLEGVNETPAIPEQAEPASSGNWVVWLLVSGGLGVAILVGLLYGRWLYYDNVFGREYTFPEAEAGIRLGGAYGGGHGAVVRYREKALQAEGLPASSGG